MSSYTGPINRNPGPGEAAIIIYGYTPSLVHGVIGAVTFLLVSLVQLWYIVRKRGHRSFHSLLFVGSVSRLAPPSWSAGMVADLSPAYGVWRVCGTLLRPL